MELFSGDQTLSAHDDNYELSKLFVIFLSILLTLFPLIFLAYRLILHTFRTETFPGWGNGVGEGRIPGLKFYFNLFSHIWFPVFLLSKGCSTNSWPFMNNNIFLLFFHLRDGTSQGGLHIIIWLPWTNTINRTSHIIFNQRRNQEWDGWASFPPGKGFRGNLGKFVRSSKLFEGLNILE